jgi:hypothetical protein
MRDASGQESQVMQCVHEREVFAHLGPCQYRHEKAGARHQGGAGEPAADRDRGEPGGCAQTPQHAGDGGGAYRQRHRRGKDEERTGTDRVGLAGDIRGDLASVAER